MTFLHGFAQFGDSWDELAALLAAHEPLAPDLSPGGPEGVLALWDRRGIERSHVVGYSMGGRLALRLAADHPGRVASLAVIGAHAGLEGAARDRRRAEDKALAARIEAEGVEWFAAYWASRPIFAGLARRGPAYLAELDARRRRNSAQRLAEFLRVMGAGATEPFWERLQAIACPTVVIVGAEDQAYLGRGRRLAELIPRARLAIVPDAGHAAHLEQPAAVAALLAAHLSSR